jgi:hypothetical protein
MRVSKKNDKGVLMRKPFPLTGTFDIECWGWQNFAVGATYNGDEAKIWNDGDEMIDHMRSCGGTWYAHAGGVYDGLYVLERLQKRGISCQVDRAQHRVSRIVVGKLTIRDSYSLWPSPLDDICGALRRDVPKLPWKCICAEKCAGYCQIRQRASDGDPDLEAYVIGDCKALYDGLAMLREWTGKHRIDLRGTLGQTAWCAAQDELGVPDSDLPFHLWRVARRADKGGRIAIVRPRARGPGSHHDICNAYPAQLAKAELPVGACRQLGSRQAALALDNARPGLYSVTAHIPEDSFLPPLPWHHGGQLVFPTGTISGMWTLPELACAAERGVTFERVHAALVWEATAPVFGELVARWYEIRRGVGRKTPLGQWIGRLAKALTGKFSERPERQRVIMHPEKISICTRKGSCRDGCTGRCGAYRQIDLDGHIWAIPYQKLGPSAYPQWSAYLRAMTRVQWLEQAEKLARTGDLCFGNTDSLWHTSRASPAPLGDGLGQWEYQHGWTNLDVRSASTYAFTDDEKILRVRGVPGLSPEDWKRGHGIIDRGIVTFARAAQTSPQASLFRKRSRRWTLPEGAPEKTVYGDREIGNAGITYPIPATVLRERAKKAREGKRT